MRASEIITEISDTESYLFRQQWQNFTDENIAKHMIADWMKNSSNFDNYIRKYDAWPLANKILKTLIQHSRKIDHSIDVQSEDFKTQVAEPFVYQLKLHISRKYKNLRWQQQELWPDEDEYKNIKEPDFNLQPEIKPPPAYWNWHEKPDEFDIETAKRTIEEMGEEFAQAEQAIAGELDAAKATPTGFTNKEVARILALSLEEPEWFLMAFGPRPDPKLAAIAVKKSPEIMRHIEPDLRTPELWLAAVGADHSALSIVNPPAMQEFVANTLGLEEQLADIKKRRQRDLDKLKR